MSKTHIIPNFDDPATNVEGYWENRAVDTESESDILNRATALYETVLRQWGENHERTRKARTLLNQLRTEIMQERVRRSMVEPKRNGAIVEFFASYSKFGPRYRYVALRQGDQWYTTQGRFSNSGLPSPCSWDTLTTWASEHACNGIKVVRP